MKRLGKRHVLPAGIILGALALGIAGFTLSEADYFFKINKSIDLFGRVYKEVALNYVDEVDPELFMEAGIDGMLSMLDPYTNYISEREGDEIDLITTGKYGGIGVTIGVREGKVTILSLMEGYSAQRQGIQPGDRILAIDGQPVIVTKPDGVRSMTRGQPGTEVHLTVEREGEPDAIEFTLVREEIQLKNITYADFIEDGVAYVRLERFSRNAGDELLLAIKDLKLKGPIRSFVLDLRDNPGGLLDVAVDIVEKFVPKGSLIVSTKGRRPETEKKYYSTEDPILPETPLIVLINKGSASASEIVAGAIQDLDRGVILGTRSYGKGLVQTITPLVYDAQLKITTAKYFTPSGRSIQEINYQRKTDSGFLPDTNRKEYRTLRGRIEFEHGGIQPDTVVMDPDSSTLHTSLLRKAMYFRFATKYAIEHRDAQLASLSSENLLEDFSRYLNEQKFSYQSDAESTVARLEEIARTGNYSGMFQKEIGDIRKLMASEKQNDLDRGREEILRSLRIELASRLKGERGRIAESLDADPQVRAARGILTNRIEYDRRLTLGSTARVDR